MVELSDYVPINLICLAVLGLLGLRKLVLMDRLHWLRVVMLTGLLWLPVICVFLSFFTYLYPPGLGCCTPPCEEPNVYTRTEF